MSQQKHSFSRREFVRAGATALLAPVRFTFAAESGDLRLLQPHRNNYAHGGQLYQETYRPQFHFTAPKGWLNDPNGLVYYKGEYHLFFQHDPNNIKAKDKIWGHAVSTDLVHWRQLPRAILSDEMGRIHSGSAVVDWNNTSGFKTGREDVLVAFYTSAGLFVNPPKPFVQSIAYSNDRGRTWIKYKHNPVLGHIVNRNRDPKVIWHKPSRKWVMALFLDKNVYALFESRTLKEWTRLCELTLPGVNECPDIFELPVEGSPSQTKWVFWGGNGKYALGDFDGQTFKAATEPLQSEWGKSGYAGQTWSDIPESDGRRLQILWLNRGKYPGMPFNQQMSFPCKLTLRRFPEGLRICREPVCEIENIHAKRHTWTDLRLNSKRNPLSEISGRLFDIRAEIELRKASEVGFTLRGIPLQFNAREETLSCLGKSAPLSLVDGKIQFQILIDRSSIEIFANQGRIVMSFALPVDPENTNLNIFARGDDAVAKSLVINELRSIWL